MLFLRDKTGKNKGEVTSVIFSMISTTVCLLIFSVLMIYKQESVKRIDVKENTRGCIIY